MTGNMWRGEQAQGWQQPRDKPLPRLQTRMPSKPQIYVHFEFGVSFTQKQQGPKPHSVTYMSRGMKERDQRTRQAPSPHAPPHNHHHHHHHNQQNNRLMQPTPHHPRARTRALTHDPQHPPSYDFSTGYSYPQDDPSAPAFQSQPTYERGGSAPPPMSDSPWDAEPEPVGFSALPRQRAAPPRTGPPPRFGPDGMPLSANSWPGAGLDDDEAVGESSRRRLNVPDSGQARDLASLSSAMMTVDNGFEDQWWYQGAREPTFEGAGGALYESRSMPTSPQDYEDTFMTGSTLGWAIANEELRPVRSSSLRNHPSTASPEEWVQATRQFSTTGPGATPALSRRDTVSPLTEYYQPTPQHQQHRRMNSEMWIYK